jgi:hypothetical protein
MKKLQELKHEILEFTRLSPQAKTTVMHPVEVDTFIHTLTI